MRHSGKNYELLQQDIGYSFVNQTLLKLALTHPSVNSEKNNDRLEFLGDAFLGFVIARQLYDLQSDMQVGRMSMMRSKLVRTTTLAEIAEEIHLDEYILLNQPLEDMNPTGQRSVLADTMEALFAAVYLDGGFKVAQSIIQKLFSQRFLSTTQFSDTDLKDAKTFLQEYMQSRSYNHPTYKVTKIAVTDTREIYQATCIIENAPWVMIAQGSSKKYAEHASARASLRMLGIAMGYQ